MVEVVSNVGAEAGEGDGGTLSHPAFGESGVGDKLGGAREGPCPSGVDS